jgi:cytosine/adenosine deaminase-related metal-dependent hydrolase
LGNVAILPGLVNAHTHLEFSDLPHPLGAPGIDFVKWVRLVIASRRRAAVEESPVAQGLRESRRLGTSALGEIAQPGWPVDLIQRANLDVTVFLELIAPTSEGIPGALTLAREHVQMSLPVATWRAGLSPHAPYTVHPELLAQVVSLSAENRIPLCMHLAESREELELLRAGSGGLRELLLERGVRITAVGRRPLDYLRMLAAAHRTLIIHGNYLDDEEIGLLAAHAQRMAVAYCPRTHAFFGHSAYPLETMLAAGVSVALGTDSRASSPDLSVLAEMRAAAARHPAVGRDVILELGTLRGAAALGLDHVLGSLAPGKDADLAVVALPDRPAADPYQLLFDSDSPVVATWHRGLEVVRVPGAADGRR